MNIEVYRIITELKQYRSLRCEFEEMEQPGLRVRTENIERFIDGIPDSELRRIFKYRYIYGRRRYTWRQIALKLGNAGDGSTERKKHNKYLEENICIFKNLIV